jgi:phosphoribosylformimino-5-aminoimidazole carboxamide ribotide isomerase
LVAVYFEPMQIIPAIDLRNGRCVRLAQGRKSAVTNYDSNPVEVASAFRDAGAELIHVVDLDGAFGEDDSPNRTVVRKILDTVDVAVEFGGGVRTTEAARQLSDLGIARIVLGTVAAESPETIKSFVELFSTKICVGIDARNGEVMSRGWESATSLKATTLARDVVASGVERIIYTDIARDGMLSGPNIEQTIAIARAAQVKVTASGGVATLDDLKRLRDSGEPLVDSVIVGKALYEGAFRLEEAIETLN